MDTRSIFICFLLIYAIFSGPDSAWAKLVIHSQASVEIELLGYNGLAVSSIFKGNLSADSKHELTIPYRGLALLVFTGGQRYPVIIEEKTFVLEIASPREPPFFVGSGDNDFLYKLLSGGSPPRGQFYFPSLMLQAKDLLDSSDSIKTILELTAKKKEFQEFVRMHYESLKHSDMIRRLIAQYFMMHEYVDFRTEGVQATDVRAEYQKEVLDGVGEWLEILKPHLSDQEIINYCVSLYYDRSMVTLASLIIENFRDVAYCTGDEKVKFGFPGDMLITEVKGTKARKLDTFKGNKLIAFVSDDCPVSMVETVNEARKFAAKKENVPVIVVPMQKLSSDHFSMAKMVNNGNMFFVADEKWRKSNLAEKIELPLFIWLGDGSGIR